MSLSRLDLNLLVTLDAVLSQRSVARAAERLNITPSAVSNALARLRLELNDPLAVRSGRGVVLTPKALSLAPALREALLALELVMRDEGFDPKTTTRRFTLALADAGQLSQLPLFSRLLATEMPNATLRVVGIDTLVGWGGAGSERVDAAITRFDDRGASALQSAFLYNERSALVARKSNAVAGRSPHGAELNALLHVDVEIAPGRGYGDLDTAYARADIKRLVAMTVPSFMAAVAVVAATDLVATLPASLVRTFRSHFDLAIIDCDVPTPDTTLHLVWHDRTHGDPACAAFRALILKTFS